MGVYTRRFVYFTLRAFFVRKKAALGGRWGMLLLGACSGEEFDQDSDVRMDGWMDG